MAAECEAEAWEAVEVVWVVVVEEVVDLGVTVIGNARIRIAETPIFHGEHSAIDVVSHVQKVLVEVTHQVVCVEVEADVEWTVAA